MKIRVSHIVCRLRVSQRGESESGVPCAWAGGASQRGTERRLMMMRGRNVW
ncbi:hypothetical protein CSUI_001798 [Cystoisospora suis]|uniref:Uncharacterized protein n=1 Tax=Cystoisospora suis TaxID=483139 RepID=A0A2C6KW70_9APIC|nr:hypothetical protein CSUI_001798 [Cystoisospora suis]